MIIYNNTIKEFNNDVLRGMISEKIVMLFEKHGFGAKSEAERRSWDQSLLFVSNILRDSRFDQEINIAIETLIPNTNKRIDLLLSGLDEKNNSQLVIVELKQWESATKTNYDGLVNTYVGGSLKNKDHPSAQVITYANLLTNFNTAFEKYKINISACAFLHNFQEKYRLELLDPVYEIYTKEAPSFLKKDAVEFQNFLLERIKYNDKGSIIKNIKNGEIKPSKALQDALDAMLKGNQEFLLVDEQKEIYSQIKKIAIDSVKNKTKATIIVEGGAGTGKSVLAVNFLVKFKDLKRLYVSKNSAPRNVFSQNLIAGNKKMSYVKSLFSGSGSFNKVGANKFDVLIVDEAHRLNKTSVYQQNKDGDQIEEIINSAYVSIFFIDEDQRVTTSDYATVDKIIAKAKKFNSKLYYGDNFKLTSQFRCNGSDAYIAFIDDLLNIRSTANKEFDLDYEIKIYDDLVQMKNDLKEKNDLNNRSRMLAGYCYNWITKKDKNQSVYDIVIDNFKAKWNFSDTPTWAIDKDSFDQVGCIHTSQGLEFEYVGLIIGKDLVFKDNKVVTNMSARAKTDTSLKGLKGINDTKTADILIKNTYKTLMTRGQKGCYIYCEDRPLAEYLKSRLATKQK
jgi:DUF2075 family protein